MCCAVVVVLRSLCVCVCVGAQITLSLPRDEFGPVVVMYGFSSFSQNYNSYYTSVITFQATGTQLAITTEAVCDVM